MTGGIAKNKKKKKKEKEKSHGFKLNSTSTINKSGSSQETKETKNVFLTDNGVTLQSHNLDAVSKSDVLNGQTSVCFEHSKETSEVPSVHVDDKQANKVIVPHDEQKNLILNEFSIDDQLFHKKDVFLNAAQEQKHEDGQSNITNSSV